MPVISLLVSSHTQDNEFPSCNDMIALQELYLQKEK